MVYCSRCKKFYPNIYISHNADDCTEFMGTPEEIVRQNEELRERNKIRREQEESKERERKHQMMLIREQEEEEERREYMERKRQKQEEKRKQKVKCECGSEVSYCGLKQHQKTKIHQSNLNMLKTKTKTT